MDSNAQANDGVPVDPARVDTLTRLPDAQIFSRDPEIYTAADLADTIERLRRILARQRKARQDDAAITAAAADLKKKNAAARKAKAKKAKPADIMETTI